MTMPNDKMLPSLLEQVQAQEQLCKEQEDKLMYVTPIKSCASSQLAETPLEEEKEDFLEFEDEPNLETLGPERAFMSNMKVPQFSSRFMSVLA